MYNNFKNKEKKCFKYLILTKRNWLIKKIKNIAIFNDTVMTFLKLVFLTLLFARFEYINSTNLAVVYSI